MSFYRLRAALVQARLRPMKDRSGKTVLEIALLFTVNLVACFLIAPASALLTHFTVDWFARRLEIDAWIASGSWPYLFLAISLGSSAAFVLFVGSLSWLNWMACKAWTTTRQLALLWTIRFAYAPVLAVLSGTAWILYRFFR
jgi:hypothetical protein